MNDKSTTDKAKIRTLKSITGISILAAIVGGAVIFAYDPTMNQGDDPKSGVDENFKAQYILLLHLELMPDQSIKAIRLKIPTTGDRRWENNKNTVAEWITKINKGEVCEKPN